ncbi:Gfo/Idh/MocA family protein [Clostridium tagluense]|uniref:Gfo/Idh/MocA family protein n=1 Tax=Clostridium tagluense TaxID=360422 RepID=UPI001CF20BDE|nr:Gfo/Idh/MocA family oxidoreductase [Clostridium tagluense]MCB2297187.1 Gfo/Idh/MocA family oxidoreductase [Clostridium tagluense]
MGRNYNVLIIGAGNIGAFFDTPSSLNILTHAHAFTSIKEFNLLGFVERDSERAKKASDLWNTTYFESLEKAFEKNRIDVVSLCVPDEYHYELLKKLSNFSIKLVFAEKPLAKNLKEAEEIISLYNKKNIKCLVNYSRRFVSEFANLKNSILSGAYGKFICGNGYYGKGTMHNGSHLIDFLRYIIGEIKETKAFNYDFDFYKDDASISAILKFKNGGNFTMNNIPCNNYTIFEIELLFEKTRIRIIDSGFKIEIHEVSDSSLFKGYRNLVKRSELNISLGNAMENAVINIYNSLSFGEKLKCTLEDGYRALEVCEKLKAGIKNE